MAQYTMVVLLLLLMSHIILMRHWLVIIGKKAMDNEISVLMKNNA
jgi:hypothetical protein